MTITEIKKIGKGQRYKLFVDEIFIGAMEAEILARYGLKTGQEISQDFLHQLKLENGDYACFDRALGLLEHGMKSQKQIEDYLAGKGYLQECIDRAIEKLESYGYINDLAFAQEYVKIYANKDGKKKIRFALISKGVDREIIDEVLEELPDASQEKTCFALAQKKAKNTELDPKNTQKLYSFLAGRGFEFEIIKRAVDKLKQERENYDRD